MVYFIVSGVIMADENYPNEEFYPSNTVTHLTQSQYNFYLANPTASVQEVLNEALNPPPPPVEPEPELPTLEERLELLEGALMEMVLGGV